MLKIVTREMIDSYKLSISMMQKIRPYVNNDEKSLERIRLGFQVWIINGSKVAFILLVAMILGLIYEALIVFFTFAFLRRTLGGVHANNSNQCTVISTIIIIGGAILSKFLVVNNIIIILSMPLLLFLTYKYAPADTKKNPIKSIDRRMMIKKQSMKKVTIILLISLVTNILSLKFMLYYGSIVVVLMILPMYSNLKDTNKRNMV